MSRTKVVIRNSAILTAQHVLINVVSIFVIGFIAKKLGHQDYGIYSLAFAFPAIFEFMGSFGLRPLTIREIARDREKSFGYLGKVIPARIIFIGLMSVTVVISAFLLSYEKRIIVSIVIALAASVFDQLSRIILDVFQAFEEMGKVAIRDVTVRIFTALASITVLFLGYGLYSVCLVYTFGALLGLIINLYLFRRRFVFPTLKLDSEFIIKNLREGSSYVIIGFASMLFTKIDVVILSKLSDLSSISIYNASATLFYRLIFMADAVSTAAFPAISQLFWVDSEKASSIFNKSFLAILLIALPVSLGGAMLSSQIITLIYGNSYLEAVNIFTIMMCAVPFMFLNTLLNYTLGAIREQQYVAKVLVVNGVLNVILNLIMIYWLGPKGAAISIFLILILNFICYAYGLGKHIRISLDIKAIVSIIASLGCLGIFVRYFASLGILIAVPGGAVLYFACLIILGGKKLGVLHLIRSGK